MQVSSGTISARCLSLHLISKLWNAWVGAGSTKSKAKFTWSGILPSLTMKVFWEGNSLPQATLGVCGRAGNWRQLSGVPNSSLNLFLTYCTLPPKTTLGILRHTWYPGTTVSPSLVLASFGGWDEICSFLFIFWVMFEYDTNKQAHQPGWVHAHGGLWCVMYTEPLGCCISEPHSWRTKPRLILAVWCCTEPLS